MCGIFGFAGDPDRARAIDLEAALRALRHRGPDGSGIFRDFGNAQMRDLGPDNFRNSAISQSSNVSCVFAHTRLAILDLSPAGAQPMTSADGRFTIVHNGEIYNYRELREELGPHLGSLGPTPPRPSATPPRMRGGDGGGVGNDWKSNSDTEVILRAFERWGPDCVERFRGMFAFAIWDRDDRSLFLARDRLGVKPLYYAKRADGIAIASEVRTLLATGFAERRLDLASLEGYLAFGSVQGPATIIEGIRSLPPGCSALFRDARLSLRRYWSLPADAASNEPPDLLELRHSLRDAVRMRLISDVPLGVFLSGGIDSSAVVALAAAASETPIHTFTVTFDEEPYNEETFAAEIASRFGCDHHQVHLSAARAAEEIEGAVRALDQPSADGVNTYFVSKAARDAGLSVALSGLGGDELFAGYPNFRRFRTVLKAGAAARFLPFHASKSGVKAFNGIPHRFRKLRALLAAGGNPSATYGVLRAMFLREQRGLLLSPELAPALDAELSSSLDADSAPGTGEEATSDPVNLFSRLEISNYLRNTLLRDTDAMSMAHSLEVRVPFLDHLLVERMLAIPGKSKVAGRRNKPLLTAAVPEIPEQVVRRPKMGFTLPMDVWFRGPQKEWLADLLSPASIRPLGFLNAASVEALWRSFLPGEKYTSWSRVWCVAALAGWCRQHDVSL
jgi:asparagine synthase (glutamine-hydrolysing)